MPSLVAACPWRVFPRVIVFELKAGAVADGGTVSLPARSVVVDANPSFSDFLQSTVRTCSPELG